MHSNMSSQLAGTISDLTISFGNKPVISNINIELFKNKIHLLTGPSGSGKTTLLRAINRLNDCFDGCHSQGEIKLHLDGKVTDVHDLNKGQLPKLRRKVGMVFQHPQLLPGSILDNLLLPLKVVCGVTGAEAQDRAYAALSDAALWHDVKNRLAMPADVLSGGQQQRLCLARTLALEPEILLLDEPTASLDPVTEAHIETLIVKLATRYTVVMVSHSIRQAQQLADHTIHLKQGKVVCS